MPRALVNGGRVGRAAVLVLFLSLAGPPGAARAEPAGIGWNPAHTWLFVVGVLEWKDSESFSAFPQKNRRDAQLVGLFRQLGVPREQTVYLQDRAATTRAIEASLQALLGKTARGDMLVLYYCGHGYKDDDGRAFFASYDASDSSPGWPVASIPAAIDRGFRGDRALLTADCCYSGSLAEAVKGRKKSYAVLASSSASELSTGHWTFTEALLTGLRGDPWVDRDADGSVTLRELAGDAADDMAFAEEQLATFARTGDFDAEMVLAEAEASPGGRVGERVEARSTGKYYRVRIVAAEGGRFRVRYFGYEASDDEWVTAADLRAFKPVQYPVGAAVEVEWKKKWYPARVLEVRAGIHRIHYDGYGAEWDEWVPSKRIRRPQR